MLTTPATTDGQTWYEVLLGVPLKIVAILVVAVVLRWLVHRVIDRTTTGLTGNSMAVRLAKGRDRSTSDDAVTAAAERVRARGRTIASLLKSVSTFIILGTAIVMVLALVDINVAPIIASAGIVGIAVGFGAQSLIKDFLTGVFMVLEDQFGVGDVVDTGQANGTVEQVGLRITTLRDDNGVIWYVPNGAIQRVGNKSQGWALAVVDVPVAYAEDLDRAMGVIRNTAASLGQDPDWSDVVLDDPPTVVVESMTSQAVHVRVALRTRPLKQTAVARELRARFRQAAEAEGIAPPSPQLPPAEPSP